MLSQQDIEEQLSYAYLHAVASKAGVGCQTTGRSFDNAGIDVMLNTCRDFGSDAKLTDLTIHVQLKATTKQPTQNKEGKLSYFLPKIEQYNALRRETCLPPILLVVMFLPENNEEWLKHTKEELILKRCAYWVSLMGAPESTNTSGQTIYLPMYQVFDPEGLMRLFSRIAKQEELHYE